jgi:hypothetical protein
MYSNRQPSSGTNLALDLQVSWRLILVPCRAMQSHPCLVRTLRPTLELVSHSVQHNATLRADIDHSSSLWESSVLNQFDDITVVYYCVVV